LNAATLQIQALWRAQLLKMPLNFPRPIARRFAIPPRSAFTRPEQFRAQMIDD
jgi:hypothetical protein